MDGRQSIRELHDFGKDIRGPPELLLSTKKVGGVGLKGEIISNSDILPFGCQGEPSWFVDWRKNKILGQDI